MQNTKGSGFLKVCGILMIIGGAISIIISILGIVLGGAMQQAGAEYSESGSIVLVAAIIALIAGILELIAGIVGVKNARKPEKATACIVWGFIVLVLQIVGLVFSLIGSGSGAGTIIISIITGIALPVLYLIGAFLNKKSA